MIAKHRQAVAICEPKATQTYDQVLNLCRRVLFLMGAKASKSMQQEASVACLMLT